MIKKIQKKNYTLLFSLFLFSGFFYLLASRALAVGLEVNYPVISGQALTVSSELPEYIQYLFNAGVIIGFAAVFISLAIAGVMYFLSPVNAGLLSEAKDRISGAISGLLILVLTYLIVTTINPQLSFFSVNKPPLITIPTTTTKAPGVYFNKDGTCSDKDAQSNTSNISDFGLLKNKINSVEIQQDGKTSTSFISVLYNSINFWGRCQYLDPNQTCQVVNPFASSASIYKYDFNPNGDGVYFYRKSYFDDSGGYYKVENSEIKGNYVGELSNMRFLDAPDEEKDCVEYDKDNNCINLVAPTLGGENISSVKIQGNYVVMFVYFGPNDQPAGPWTSCQEFPTPDDINKTGPQQIKWQNVRNNDGVVPNYVIILPIKY